MTDIPPTPAARAVARACRTATLATTMAEAGKSGQGGQPYASLVLLACDLDAAPLLLVSTLAEHTKNILADNRVSLLCDGTTGFTEPLTGPRVTLLGFAEKTELPRHQTRFLARHPSAEGYAGFRDFAFYRVSVTRAHIVAGFGKIHWLDDYTYSGDWQALAEAEAGIIAHMNTDHAEAVQLYATKLLGRTEGTWRMCGVDPEGADLIRTDESHEGELLRLPFAKPVSDAEGARVELVRLVKQARAA
ncbi:DUF2470 domain-containing protein [Ferrovibrio sp.]|uniref:HugZ family pyridoxamine 5'-phosphate oxidase n=1 Tax=Ferrovibrio sp. TaxID=1917215 RepID=UPI0026036043|nr:DUF2470 domain-containing protein [Ferrovibrio sp.]